MSEAEADRKWRIWLQLICGADGSWIDCIDSARILWQPGEPDGDRYEKPLYMPRTEEDTPHYTPEQELAMMQQEIDNSEGFDIDFSLFRCVFNYYPVELDSHNFVDEPETTRDLLNKLSLKSLDAFNKKNETKYEFVKVVKANYYFAATAFVFLITFQVTDPYDGKIKLFQARIRDDAAEGDLIDFDYCRPKPNQEVEYYGTVKNDVEKDAKKQRLE